MIQENYKSLYNSVTPDVALINDTLRRINTYKKRKTCYRRPAFRRPAIIIAALMVCMLSITPVLAANVPVFYALLYKASPATAQFFMPVQKTCVDNGIKMEVLGTYIHEDTAEVFITLQDLEGNRVDATTDLYDSYSINRPFSSSATCGLAGYDPETNTATFLINITEWDGHDITGDKMTFSVRRFISDKHVQKDRPLDLPLPELGEAAVIETHCTGYGGLNFEKYNPDDGTQRRTIRVLKPGEVLSTPAEGIDITGIGYVDGLLHIQTAVYDGLKGDNHCRIYLKDQDGNERQSDFSLSFIKYGEEGNEDTRVDYCDFVFDIPSEKFDAHNLYGDFYTSSLYTEGNWQVTFPLVPTEPDAEKISVD